MRELERRVVLSVIDRKWRDHLYEMDYLKDGIGLRAMAQRDPLVEYQREGYTLFQQMMGSIREETVGYLFNLEVEVKQPSVGAAPVVAAKGLGQSAAPVDRLSYSAPSAEGEVEVRNERGQLQQADTLRAQRSTQSNPTLAKSQAPAAPAQKGAFGKAADVSEAPPAGNRAERRAQQKKGR
jgi:preprotein translocase subunit SecA